jgi:hypothetical protein
MRAPKHGLGVRLAAPCTTAKSTAKLEYRVKRYDEWLHARLRKAFGEGENVPELAMVQRASGIPVPARR